MAGWGGGWEQILVLGGGAMKKKTRACLVCTVGCKKGLPSEVVFVPRPVHV